MTIPALRVPVLAWAWRESGSTTPRDLTWVDATPDPDRPEHAVRDDRGSERFRGPALEAVIPPPMVAAAREARARGEATALEGLALLLARTAWQVETRELWWTAASPVPRLLASLVEAYGVDAEAHREDPERLVNLRARLPGWHAVRGDARAALDVLEGALDAYLGVELPPPGRDVEVLACREAAWWAERGAPTSEPRVGADGIVTLDAPPAPRPEDVLLAVDLPVGESPRALLRLLPAWASPRLQHPRER
jgi:hypothetical protein